MADRMKQCNSVSVHMRFGDYVNNLVYENICTEEYYRKSIEYVKLHIENPVFFVISDDLVRAQSILSNDNYVLVDINRGDSSYLDMYLISTCRHHIMANSSFSWWGVFFSESGGIVVEPDKWININDSQAVWCDGWIKIKG